jgi:putative hydrolase of the HAD superfamily
MLSEAMSIPEAEARRLIAERFYRKSEDLLVNMPLYSGVREAIHELAEMGLKLGVVSDFPVVRKLTILNLSDIWDCAYSTEDTGYLKPNPEAFAPLEECMDLPPREILYVGNSYPYDIIGASRAGFRTAYLSRREPKDSIADLTFFRYPALVEWIRARVA